jgi:hypothetical protein
MVSETTKDVVEKALKVVPTKEVLAWLKDNIGQSLQSMRKEAFGYCNKKEQKRDQILDKAWIFFHQPSSELLTKGDIPKPEERKENVPQEKTGEGTAGAGTGDPKAPEKPGEDDWRKVFSAVPAKPKAEEPAVKPAVNPNVKPACTTGPKKEKETWKSKFENIKSATATHKGKGG